MSEILVNTIKKADGTGSITVPADSGTLLTSVSSITQNTGPAFSAYLSTNQSISATTFTKILIDTEFFDADNSFDTSTSRFQPNIAGYYTFIAGMCTTSGSNVSRQILSFFKNGSELHRPVDLTQTSSSYATRVHGSAHVYLNGSTDYIELYGWQSGSSVSFQGDDGRKTIFQGYLVRAA